MSNTCIERGLIIAALAALISGCAGPRVVVEDRSLPEIDRSRVMPAKTARIAPKAAAESRSPAARTQSPCTNSSIVIHPVHFDTAAGRTEKAPCPLLSWEVRTAEPQIASSPR